jgi:hypothetical protein
MPPYKTITNLQSTNWVAKLTSGNFSAKLTSGNTDITQRTTANLEVDSESGDVKIK